jgi:hypothetical protein
MSLREHAEWFLDYHDNLAEAEKSFDGHLSRGIEVNFRRDD